MFEAATTCRTRVAFKAAHAARGCALKEFWAWLTRRLPTD